jgi:colanic acid biosynthesis glycosyl transferase WcaI
MKIQILGFNYLPESTSIGPYTADLAEYLQQRGHQVRVITGFPIAPQWKIWDGYRGKMFMREVVHGIPVLRTYTYVPDSPRKALQRILFDCSFAASALIGALTGPSPDLVIAISPPLQLAVTGWLIGILRRARIFLQIQDLVPDAAVAVGSMHPGSRAFRLAQALERFAYSKAGGIGVICEGMRRNLIAKGVRAEKVALLPNYIDSGFIRPMPRDNDFRARFGIGKGEFLVVYSGSVAAKQGLQTFVEASALLHDDGVTCCLIGEGPHLSELQELAARISPRFRFLPLQPRETLSEQLSAADVLVITQKKTVKDIVFPGKLLYYMSSGRPILAAVSADSETGQFINEYQVGTVVPPEDPGLLAAAIFTMRTQEEHSRRCGANGRHVVETQFDRAIVLDRMATCLETGRPVVPREVSHTCP